MLTTSNSQIVSGFKTKLFQQILLSIFVIFWTIYAISPVYRPEWWLENYLVFALLLFLFLSYKKFQLSDFSYLLITIFLLFHTVGAHYGYSNVPFGFVIKNEFGLLRNPYDRVVHFLFGIIFAYTIYEFLKRYSSLKGNWIYLVTLNLIISLSAVYEMIEAVVALTFPPERYDAFVGLQGDIWDGYKDMMLVSGGGLLSTLLIWLNDKRRKK